MASEQLPLVALAAERQPALAFKASRSLKAVACLAGSCAVAVVLVTAAAWLQGGAPVTLLRDAWRTDHVQSTCDDVQLAGDRRLSGLPDVLGGPFARRLTRAAEFDPAFLFHLTLGGSYRMPYYGTADLEADLPNAAERVVMIVHGARRDAQKYFCSARALLKGGPSEQSHDRTIIIAPKFHYSVDRENEGYSEGGSEFGKDLFWNASKPMGDWRGGAAADGATDSSSSSYSVIDKFLLHLDEAGSFPMLRTIVVVGHSAGGQTVQRYALMTHLRPGALAHDPSLAPMPGVRPEVEVRFVVANPSSYAYLNNMRWVYDYGGGGNWTENQLAVYKESLGRTGWQQRPSKRLRLASPGLGFGFANGSLENRSWKTPFVCSSGGFNMWPYGLRWSHPRYADLVPYLRGHHDLSRAAEFYAHRSVVYLVGQNDTCSDFLPGGECPSSCWTRDREGTTRCTPTMMDTRCPAMLQGPNRNERARNYKRHVDQFFGRPVHTLLEVPNTGHQAAKMLSSEQGRLAMFGDLDQLAGSV